MEYYWGNNMRIRKCDLCECYVTGNLDDTEDGVSFIAGRVTRDLCGNCVIVVRTAICRNCKGTGKIKVTDYEATKAQATCGKSRIEYKTVECQHCL